MMWTKWSVVGALASRLLVSVPTPVLAQAQVTVLPESLNIAGTRNSIETRTLLIQTSQPVDGVTITPLDLNRTDGSAVLPASLILVDLSTLKQAPVNGALSIPLQFDLHRLSNSGEFRGLMLLTHSSGQIVIPVTAKVKDSVWLPLLLLLIGVGLGVWLSAYRSEGRFYDESVVKVGQLRVQMRSDAQLAEPFRIRVEEHLIDVETALANKRFEQAQQFMANAQAVWDKWRKGRNDWIVQLEYQRNLKEKLEELDPDTPYEQVVRVGLEDSIREAVDQNHPAQLRKTLQNLQQQISNYLQANALIDELTNLNNRLSLDDRNEVWRREILDIRRQLNNLSPGTSDDYAQWKANIEQVRRKLIDETQQPTEGVRSPKIISRGVESVDIQSLSPVPSTRSYSNDAQVKVSRRRLHVANFLSYGIVVSLLAITGFNQLYLNNSTFGARLGDYFALLAWGFGAEATTESIAKVMQRWGLTGSL